MVRLQAEGIYPPAFASIRVPVLMMHGTFDPHPGQLIRGSLQPYLPQLEYHEWERCGHYPWLEKAARDKFFSLIREWLGRTWEAKPQLKMLRLSLQIKKRCAILPRRSRSIRTLIKHFQYPRLGPGMMWSRVREIVEERGSQIRLNSPVEKVMWETGRVIAVRSEGRVYRAKHFISSIPIRELIEALDPVPPEPCGARLVISTTAISLRWRSLYGAVIYFRTTGFIYTTQD